MLVPLLVLFGVFVVTKIRMPRATAAEIAEISLATTPERLTEQLNVRERDGTVSFSVTSGRFREAELYWHTSDRDHVTRVVLEASFETPTEVIDRAKAQLGPALRFIPVARDDDTTELADLLAGGSDTWAFEAPAVTLVFRSGDYGGLRVPFKVDLRVHDFDDPSWKDQIDALWVVLSSAAFDRPGLLEDHQRSVLRLDEIQSARD